MLGLPAWYMFDIPVFEGTFPAKNAGLDPGIGPFGALLLVGLELAPPGKGEVLLTGYPTGLLDVAFPDPCGPLD
jgi:hypothetical protein